MAGCFKSFGTEKIESLRRAYVILTSRVSALAFSNLRVHAFLAPCSQPQRSLTTPTTLTPTMSAAPVVMSTPRPSAPKQSLSDSLKRKLQVYVEIPPSPLHTSFRSPSTSNSSKVNAFTARHSGTPLSMKALNFNTPNTPDVKEPPLKKQKPSVEIVMKKPDEKAKKTMTSEERQAKLIARFPNGYILCHHCRQYKDIDREYS